MPGAGITKDFAVTACKKSGDDMRSAGCALDLSFRRDAEFIEENGGSPAPQASMIQTIRLKARTHEWRLVRRFVSVRTNQKKNCFTAFAEIYTEFL
jgi:hypothetical protein